LAGPSRTAVQKDDALAVLDGVQVQVGHAGVFLRQCGQLEVVGREQREGADARGQLDAQAQASDRPSKVLVPRPISSISTRLRSLALCRMLAVSSISTMKVERPPARSSAAPMREKMRSTGPMRARARGDEAAGVGHQHDQRDLAHIGGLAAHVRAGDDQHPALIVEANAVGDEGLAAAARPTCSTTGWRPSSISIEGSSVQLRAGPVERSARSARLHSTSSVAMAAALVCSGARSSRSLQQLLVEGLFACQGALAGAQHLVLEALQLRRDVALGALQRLSALVVVGHPVGVAAADLDVVAVHAVVADLERGDAGALALALFQVEQERSPCSARSRSSSSSAS
jgi:hypothetical protein